MTELQAGNYDRELSELLAGLLDENLSDAQFERLNERLLNEPAARQKYLDYIEIHDELPDVVVSLMDGASHGEVDTELNSTAVDGARKQIPIRSYRTAFWAGTAVAAMLLVGVTLNWFWPVNAGAPAIADVQSEVHFANLAHARFFGELTPSIRSTPVIDRDYVLQAGMVELAFPKGATAIIQAPAVFRVKSEEHLALHVGSCSVHAPPGAEGFHVETPATCVVDRGTPLFRQCF